jgi:hypothetical protein
MTGECQRSAVKTGRMAEPIVACRRLMVHRREGLLVQREDAAFALRKSGFDSSAVHFRKNASMVKRTSCLASNEAFRVRLLVEVIATLPFSFSSLPFAPLGGHNPQVDVYNEAMLAPDVSVLFNGTKGLLERCPSTKAVLSSQSFPSEKEELLRQNL